MPVGRTFLRFAGRSFSGAIVDGLSIFGGQLRSQELQEWGNNVARFKWFGVSVMRLYAVKDRVVAASRESGFGIVPCLALGATP
jgi:hypothetical protein